MELSVWISTSVQPTQITAPQNQHAQTHLEVSLVRVTWDSREMAFIAQVLNDVI